MAEVESPETRHTPRIGDMVHYVTVGTACGRYPTMCCAAIITAVTPNGVGLWVLNPAGQFWNRDIYHQANDAAVEGTWHNIDGPSHIDPTSMDTFLPRGGA